MSPETPQFNPSERLPFGMKVPDNPEYQAAVAEMDRENAANAEKRRQQAELKNARILSPEQANQVRAEVQAKIEEQRRKIKEMN
ncbi:MAG: hypothetical protein NTW66_02095 [Candidatus Magasanikbacteria bacterium]|nr:hypothetical protein [Candidatus Magasanikbacteria bacterium]